VHKKGSVFTLCDWNFDLLSSHVVDDYDRRSVLKFHAAIVDADRNVLKRVGE
tara:strand:+ start:501 stop:656 length:156 start_codon:yes stop_codon:yes gene_type:complete